MSTFHEDRPKRFKMSRDRNVENCDNLTFEIVKGLGRQHPLFPKSTLNFVIGIITSSKELLVINTDYIVNNDN